MHIDRLVEVVAVKGEVEVDIECTAVPESKDTTVHLQSAIFAKWPGYKELHLRALYLHRKFPPLLTVGLYILEDLLQD